MKGYFVYKYLDKSGKALYVGKTTSLNQRLACHVSVSECGGYKADKVASKIMFVELGCKEEMDFLELSVISELMPTFNSEPKQKVTLFADIPEDRWINYLSVKKFGSIQNRKNWRRPLAHLRSDVEQNWHPKISLPDELDEKYL